MYPKHRSLIALAALFLVAGSAYAFLEWYATSPVNVRVSDVATTTDQTATTTDPEPEPEPEEVVPTSSAHAFGVATLRLKEAAAFPNGLVVQPISILEDSRCPPYARCFQAGTVRVSVNIVSGLGTSVNEFSPGTTITTEAESVTLLGVSPENDVGGLNDSDYRFIFEVQPRKGSDAGGCFVGGCSQQLCTDDPGAISTCEYRAEYACYRTARCERQRSGECGWTETAELRACLANPPELD